MGLLDGLGPLLNGASGGTAPAAPVASQQAGGFIGGLMGGPSQQPAGGANPGDAQSQAVIAALRASGLSDVQIAQAMQQAGLTAPLGLFGQLPAPAPAPADSATATLEQLNANRSFS